MKKILEFTNKFGMLILIVLGLSIFTTTCGTKGSIEKTNRRIDKIEPKKFVNLQHTLIV